MKKGCAPSKERQGVFMDIDYGKVKNAANLPEEQFASLIYAVLLASGATKSTALAASANASLLKKKLAGASDRELRQLTEGIDPQVLEGILSTLKEGADQGG